MMATLAELQSERERLKALEERRLLADELAATLESREVQAALQAGRAEMQRAIAELPERLLEAVDGETEESRIHYRLSDACIDWLREQGQALQGLEDLPESVAGPLVRAMRPRDLLTVSQWADRHRFMESGTNVPGQWRTDRAPYLREIMDSLSEHSPVRQVTFQKAAGVGGTEVMYNWVGYIMHHLGNKDTLLVVPTLELRNRALNPRLRKTFKETPVLSELVTDQKRNRANRDDLVEYGAQARIIKAGANSPDSLRSDHLPYVIADEIDAFPWDLGQEGDPLSLIRNRQRTFSRAKTYLVSTPTVEHESHVASSYATSDQRQYHVPCPHCDHRHPLEWRNFQYRLAPGATREDPTAEIAATWMECPACGEAIEEHHKPDMLAAGHWIPQRPGIKAHRGYHLNALYAPVGLGPRWADLARDWRQAQNDTAKLKAFTNTHLGEVWTEQGESIEDVPLITRLETVDPRDLKTLVTTAGVDVQQDRLEATIVQWAEAEEAWVLDHVIIAGDTLTPEPWDQLEPTLRDYGVQFVAVDAGYNTGMVQTWVQPRGWSYATKGIAGLSRPLIEDERKRRQRLRYRRKKGAPVEPIGVDEGKALIYSRIKRETPGPGYIHWIDGPAFDDEYFAQIASEKLVRKRKRGRDLHEWVAIRPRNEALDCLILALVALRLSGRSVEPGAPAMEKVTASDKPAQKTKRRRRASGLARDDWNL